MGKNPNTVTFYYWDEDLQSWIEREPGAHSYVRELTSESKVGKRIEPPPNSNPEWYIDVDTYQWRKDPLPFMKMVRQGLWPLPSVIIPSIPNGLLTAMFVTMGLFFDQLMFTISGVVIGAISTFTFIAYAVSKEKATHEPAYVDLGGFLIGFALGAGGLILSTLIV